MPAQEIIPSDIALNSTLQAVRDRLPSSLGANISDASLSVALATDQSTVPVDGTVVITNTSGSPVPVSASSLPLPAGAATQTTLANLETLLTTLAGTIQNHNAVFTDGSPGQVMLGKRRDSDSTAVADGDLNTINMDEEGRIKVSSKPASYPDITGDITAVQATIGTPVAGGTVAGDVSRASNIMAFCTGTFSTVNCTFEGSIEATGDTNWFGIQAVRSNANTIETTTGNLSAQPAYGWEMSVNALKRVRVRCTARTSGTQSWRFVQGTYATEPIPAAQISGTQPVSGTVTATVANATVASGSFAIPATVADVASAALTTTTTTGTLTPTAGVSYQVNIPVTVVSGTNPTLDVRIEESDDTGTNWYTVFEFPRITTTGSYRSPMLPVRGNRIRYVQTVGGTTPSFTRAINRLQSNLIIDEPIRQIVDRSIVLTTLNSTTPSLGVFNCRNVSLTVNVGAITTTAPALQIEGSDDNGASWYTVGSPLTAVASSTVKVTVNSINCGLIRARVSTAGVGVTAGYVLLRGF